MALTELQPRQTQGFQKARRVETDDTRAVEFPPLAVEEQRAVRPEQAEALEQGAVVGAIAGHVGF